jgi:hypothetical protein
LRQNPRGSSEALPKSRADLRGFSNSRKIFPQSEKLFHPSTAEISNRKPVSLAGVITVPIVSPANRQITDPASQPESVTGFRVL